MYVEKLSARSHEIKLRGKTTHISVLTERS